jgi:hypothetical protein
MGGFRDLFGARKQEQTLTPEQADLVEAALRVLLEPQINALGYQLGAVPTDDEFVTEKCRGYLYGLPAGVLHQYDLLTVGGLSGRDALNTTFQMVYGPVGLQFVVTSLKDIQKPDFRAASEFAIQEVDQIYRMHHRTTALGFYHCKIGQL